MRIYVFYYYTIISSNFIVSSVYRKAEGPLNLFFGQCSPSLPFLLFCHLQPWLPSLKHAILSSAQILMSKVLKRYTGLDSVDRCDWEAPAKENACIDMDVAHDVMQTFTEEHID
jgi:hypothetical protein